MARPKSESPKKTARISLLMEPELSDAIYTLAQINKTTVNDLICSLIAQAVKKNHKAIVEVQAVINKVSGGVALSLDFGE